MPMETRLTAVINGAAGAVRPTRPPFELSQGEQAVLLGIQQSGADEAPRLMTMLLRDLRKAATTEQRQQALAPYANALAQRGQDLTTLEGLLLSVLNTGASRAAWHTLLQAAPGVGSAAALAQFAQAIYSRSWSSVTTALTALAPLLPALRSIDQVNQLILALPAALRDQLDVLHQQIRQMDDALTPDLGIRELGPALAICTLLWYAQRRLPTPSRPLGGLSGFITRLPDYWQRLVALDRTGNTLFAPPRGESTALAVPGDAFEGQRRVGGLQLPRAVKMEMVRCRRATDQRDLSACPYADDLVETFRNLHRIVSADHPLDVAVAPGSLQSGGEIAQAPELTRGTAASSAGSAFGSAWPALCGVLMTFFGQRMQQAPAPGSPPLEVEMSLLGSSAGQGTLPRTVPPDSVPVDMTTVTDRLLSNDPSAPLAAVGGTRLFRRHPIAVAVGITGFVGGVLGSLWYYLKRHSDEPVSTLDLGEALFRDRVVSVKGRWGTGVDLLLGTPSLPGKRERRDAADPAADNPAQLGLTAEQRDSLLADSELTAHLRALQALSLATAQDVAAHDGWQWVARLPASEQELLVSQLHVLQSLDPALKAAESMPQILLDDALQAAGWNRGGAGITVDLGTTRVAGTRVEQQMPLLHYCLLRAGDTPPGAASFRDSAGVLSDSQQAQLRAFTATAACTGLQSSVAQHSDTLRPLLQDALRARLVIDALQAKSQRVLGSGDMQLRGADIVLGFLQGAQDVESSTLIYADTLEDGKKVSLHVPNYLVLRSASEDVAVRGQVVVYRADLASFRSFKSERAFREYLDAYRASGNLHVVGGALDPALIEDIVAAAPPVLRPQVRERIAGWTEGQNMFQAGKTGRLAWNARDSFKLDFKPVSQEGQGLQAWSTALVNQGQQQKQQLESNRLRWTPLGIANVAAEAAYATHLRDHVKTLHDHARPELTTELVRALRNAGVSADLQAFNPDQVTLRLGGHAMSLTDWAINGWQLHGWWRPELPVNLGDAPDAGVGLPAQRLSDDSWPSAEELYALEVTANRAVNGSADAVPDEALTRALHSERARRAICTVLEELAESNRLAERYIAHLKQLAADRNGSLHTVAADQIRTHLRWMIEEARSTGQLDAGTCTALIASHAGLEPAKGRPSSLKAVTLNGHTINGLWSLAAGSTRYVFVPATAAGDQLMREDDFRRWVQRPESEAYVLSRAALRHHEDLEDMFRKRASVRNIRLDFAPTQGPRQAARAYIDARVSDVDRMTVSRLERFTQALTIFGSVVAAASCTLASGGSMLALCATSTLALFAKGLHDGVDMLERGRVHVDDAIESIGGSVIDLLDVLNLGAIPGLLYRLGREVDSVTSARKALDQLQRQARGFSEQGKVNAAFAVSTSSLRESGLPPLKLARVDGDVYAIGGKQYVRQDGRYLQVTDDGADLRLVDPQMPAEVGAPLAWDNTSHQWQLKPLPPRSSGVTTLRPLNSPRETVPQKPAWVDRVPQANALSKERIDTIETVFGARVRNASPSADLRQVVQDMTIEQRVQQIVADPSTLGLPGDEPVLMRSWPDSKLGNGKSVETYVNTIGEFSRGARFGNGPVGLVVEVADTRSLPDLTELVDAAGHEIVASRLGLSPTISRPELLIHVRDELARVIAGNPQQSILTWKRWLDRKMRLPTAADNLAKHFPELTRTEAMVIADQASAVQKRELEAWIFNKEIRKTVSEALEHRQRRQERQAIVNNELRGAADVRALQAQLQGVLPGRHITVGEDGRGGTVLSLAAGASRGVEVRVTFLNGNGQAMRVTDAAGTRHDTWHQALFPQLSASERGALEGPEQLRTAVLQRMKETFNAVSCNLGAGPGPGAVVGQNLAIGKRKKRSPICELPGGFSLTADDIARRDNLARNLGNRYHSLNLAFLAIRRVEWEYKDLVTRQMQLKKQKQGLEPSDAKRLEELKRDFRTLNGYDSMNMAHYQQHDIRHDGVVVAEMPVFPDSGYALSTLPRQWMTPDSFVYPEPVRRALLPANEAEGTLTFSGMFRETYPLGSDLFPVVGKLADKGQPSRRMTFTEQDLQVASERWQGSRPLHELSVTEIGQLTPDQLSVGLREAYGDAAILPVNAKTLRPGDYYVYQIRSCSESKILGGWFQALETAVPQLAPTLRGMDLRPNMALTGRLDIISEMDPCAMSCERRLDELFKTFPNMKFSVYYVFDDPKDRLEFMVNEKLRRVTQRFEDEWAAAGHSNDSMRGLAAAALKTPAVMRMIEEDMLARPPQFPVPRVWTPQVQETF